MNSIEICWTGNTENRQIRKTGPALSELILSARKNILIVGYSININMKGIIKDLEKKSKEGVKLVFLIDKLTDKEEFLNWACKLPFPPELYDWPGDPNDPISSLHIKCVIIDEKKAMFGSANLTYHGLKGNRELGLILKDESLIKIILNLLEDLKDEEMIKFDLSTVK